MIIEDLATELETTAEWRSEKTEQFPDDPRNAEAADLLMKVAANLRSIDGTPEAKRFEALHDFVFAEGTLDETSDAFRLCERWNEYRSRIGFDHYPDLGKEYLDDLMDIAFETLPSTRYLDTQ